MSGPRSHTGTPACLVCRGASRRAHGGLAHARAYPGHPARTSAGSPSTRCRRRPCAARRPARARRARAGAPAAAQAPPPALRQPQGRRCAWPCPPHLQRGRLAGPERRVEEDGPRDAVAAHAQRVARRRHVGRAHRQRAQRGVAVRRNRLPQRHRRKARVAVVAVHEVEVGRVRGRAARARGLVAVHLRGARGRGRRARLVRGEPAVRPYAYPSACWIERFRPAELTAACGSTAGAPRVGAPWPGPQRSEGARERARARHTRSSSLKAGSRAAPFASAASHGPRLAAVEQPRRCVHATRSRLRRGRGTRGRAPRVSQRGGAPPLQGGAPACARGARAPAPAATAARGRAWPRRRAARTPAARQAATR
jgi:hypothetical protein